MNSTRSDGAKNGPWNQRTREHTDLTEPPKGSDVGTLRQSFQHGSPLPSYRSADGNHRLDKQRGPGSAVEVEELCRQESRIVTDQVVNLLEGTAKDMLMQGRVAMCLDAAKLLDESAAKLTSRDAALVRDTLHAHAAQFRAIAAKGGAL